MSNDMRDPGVLLGKSHTLVKFKCVLCKFRCGYHSHSQISGRIDVFFSKFQILPDQAVNRLSNYPGYRVCKVSK